MRRIAKFHKVSLEQFMSAVKDEFPEYSEADIKDIYESIELPKCTTFKVIEDENSDYYRLGLTFADCKNLAVDR